MKGDTSLNQIELDLLGDLDGKEVLHLQCHFGQDTLSLERLGAKVTGVDFSEKAIETAQGIAKELGLNAQFVCCNIYDLPTLLLQQFDVIFTSYGTIGWLPDLGSWAAIISQYLKPGGKFIIVEFHPLVWMYDSEFKDVTYSYFKTDPIIEVENGTYADANANLSLSSVSWNHGLSEVFSALVRHQLTVTHFKEYNYSPYDIFSNMQKLDHKKYVIKKFGNKLPLVYSMVAIK
jgi:SAM-dependent methyltransferase